MDGQVFNIVFNAEAARYLRRMTERPELLPAHLGAQINEMFGRAGTRLADAPRVQIDAVGEIGGDGDMMVRAKFGSAARALIRARAIEEEIDDADVVCEMVDRHFRRKNAWAINGCRVEAVEIP